MTPYSLHPDSLATPMRKFRASCSRLGLLSHARASDSTAPVQSALVIGSSYPELSLLTAVNFAPMHSAAATNEAGRPWWTTGAILLPFVPIKYSSPRCSWRRRFRKIAGTQIFASDSSKRASSSHAIGLSVSSKIRSRTWRHACTSAQCAVASASLSNCGATAKD